MPFLLRRGAAQATLLTAVLGIVVAGGTLIGTGALLLTEGAEAAARTALARTDPADLQVEVVLRLSATGPAGAVEQTRASLTAATEPFQPSVSTWLTSAVRTLVDLPASAYLVGATDVTEDAELVDGRWPAGDGSDGSVLETAIPVVAAQRLGLDVGDPLVLDELRDGSMNRDRPGAVPQALVVVGVYRSTTTDAASWSRDLLLGAGLAAEWSRGSAAPVELVGPLLVDPTALLAAEPSVDRVSMVATVGTVEVGATEREAVRRELASLVAHLRDVLGDRTSAERVSAPLRHTLTAAATHERVIGSVIGVVVLLGTALAGAALGLAGRLVAVRRSAESALLAARGARRSQLVARASVEAVGLGLLAAALAVPLALLVHARLRSAADVAGATNGVTALLVVTVGVGVLLLTGALVAPTWRAADPQPRGRRSVRAQVAQRSLDAVLIALAVVGYLQLKGHPMSGPGGTDPVLVLAPTLCLVAGAVVGLRLVPWVARWAEARSRRSRRLVVPLATWEVARRRHSAGAALLLVLATATGIFAISLEGTWSLSMHEQADAEIGSDLEVTRTGTESLPDALALAEVTGGSVHPVVDREIVLGTPTGGAAPGTRLLAFDTTTAAVSLHGRLPAGTSWAELTAPLTPAPVPGIGLAPADGAIPVTIAGGLVDGRLLRAFPTLVVRGEGGALATLTGDVVPLDGVEHTVSFMLPDGTPPGAALDVIGVGLELAVPISDGPLGDTFAMTDERTGLDITVTFPDARDADPALGEDGARWSATLNDRIDDTPPDPTVSRTGSAHGVVLTSRASVLAGFLGYTHASVLLLAGPPAGPVPVAISADLARAIAASPGDLLALDLDEASVAVRVDAVLPALAALPHGASMLADRDTLARATLTQAVDAELVDLWWLTDVADPEVAAEAVMAQGLGEAATRASVTARAVGDPLHALLRAALVLLVVAACGLAVAGTVLQTAATLTARAVDVARLLGMGVPTRMVTAALVLEHAIVSTVAVLAGSVVGGLCAWFIGPLLVVSADGGPPVPAARPVWSWPAQGGLLVVLLLGCAAVAAPVAADLVRRARAAHLRMDVAS